MTSDSGAPGDENSATGDSGTVDSDEPTVGSGDSIVDGQDTTVNGDDGKTDDFEEVSEALLVEVVKRAPLFDLLAEGPREMSEMVDHLEMSRSTVHRATQSLTEKGLLRNRDGTCELTGYGRTIADEVADFRRRVAGASKLQAFLNTADTDAHVPVAKFADATIHRPKPRQPHFAVKRIIELMEDSESVRLFSSIISPFYVDVAYREMLDGTEIEVVFDPKIVEIIATEYTEKALKAAETGKFDVLVHDGVPFELFVFDDSVGMAAHDDGGIARVFVESDAPEAVSWGEEMYEAYRTRATAIDVDSF